MPRDTNALGTIFGGIILSYIDQAGAVEAHRRVEKEWSPWPCARSSSTSRSLSGTGQLLTEHPGGHDFGHGQSDAWSARRHRRRARQGHGGRSDLRSSRRGQSPRSIAEADATGIASWVRTGRKQHGNGPRRPRYHRPAPARPPPAIRWL